MLPSRERSGLNNMKQTLAYYITPHGFGHAIRSCEVLRQLTLLEPDRKIVVVSNLPEWLIEENVGKRIPMRQAVLDIGLVQDDSIRFDLDRTLTALNELLINADELVRRERDFLQREKVGVVVSDISFLPFEAAHGEEIPSIGISNFTWDWIYRAYESTDPGWGRIVSRLRHYYGRCSLFLQLPLHGDCSSCPNIEDIPLVARKARTSSDEVRHRLGYSNGDKVFLVSFSSLHLPEHALAKLEKLKDCHFLYKGPLRLPLANARSIDDPGLPYVDVTAAVDAVITKPGYGIVSDCLANGTPIAYTERGLFPEYPILVEAIEANLTAAYIPAEKFINGDWEEAMRQIYSRPRIIPEMEINGAEIAARRILSLLKYQQ